MTLSIRATLTAWYVGALAVVTLSFAGASWWLSTQSVLRATDAGLRARIDGVRAFLENPRTRLTVVSLRDEFAEYAELTQGEALLEVVDASGTVLCRPAVPGWSELKGAHEPMVFSGEVEPTDRSLRGQPFRIASARLVARGDTFRVIVAAPMKPAYEALRRFHQLQLWLVPVLISLAGVGGYWISRRALAPVDEVTHAVQAITVHSLGKRLDLPRANDELRRLAGTFNDVLERLELAVSDIVRFTADASHELRTPVSIIRTTAELALRHSRETGEYRTALSEIEGHAQHMSELVNDLLVLARADAGIEPQATAAVDVGKVAAEARDALDALCARHAIPIDLSPSPHALFVTGDEVSLRRLVIILLENAVKYSQPGGHVRLSVQRGTEGDEARAVIRVSDDGIGMEPSDRRRVFERFYRGERARQHAPDGTGLGLAIAQTIVTKSGGAISIVPSSGSDSTGCDVAVSLPLASRAAVNFAAGARSLGL